MSSRPLLSAVIIALDAADVLAGALRSLPPGAEMVLADGGSSDDTKRVASELGATVVEQDLSAIADAGGVFDIARNAAAAATRGEWILHLDADERLTPDLADEIIEVLSGNPDLAAYEIPRQNLYWGQPVRLLGNDFQLRLVRRGRGHFSETDLHLRMEVDGAIGRLESPLLHLNVRSWRDIVVRFRRYVPIQAQNLGRQPPLWECLSRPLHLFRYYYWRNGAFRDGLRGLAISTIYALQEAAVLWTARRTGNARS